MSEIPSYEFIADLYDHVPLYRDRGDIEFYVDVAKQSGGPVLEIGCGTGRVLIPTARAGVTIVGIDSSPHMLDICRRRLEGEPSAVRSRVRLVQAEMTAFQLPEMFNLATMPFRPFQHLLTVEGQVECLSAIRKHLPEKGRLVFDIFNPSLDALANRPIGEELDPEPEFSTGGGRRVLRRHKTVSHDPFNQVSHYELIYYVTHPDGRKERLVHAFALRYLFRFEVEHLLARAGFTVEAVYADFDRSPYGSKYPGDLIFVAKKA